MRRPGSLEHLAAHVASRLRARGHKRPSEPVIRKVLRELYYASLRTEEGRFVGASLTFADPRQPDRHPPMLRRHNYPRFFSLGVTAPLTSEQIVKHGRAVDSWSAAIAVYGTKTSNLNIWGFVDQLVENNVSRYRENDGGFDCPGILTLYLEGVGAVSAYSGNCFLGAIRAGTVTVREYDAFAARNVRRKVEDAYQPIAENMCALLEASNSGITQSELSNSLLSGWSDSLSRVCIGLRRQRCGGSVVITPAPRRKYIQGGKRVRYDRLGDMSAYAVLSAYDAVEARDAIGPWARGVMPRRLYGDFVLSEADQIDAAAALSAAVKVVTGFASTDGAVLVDQYLRVIRFGAKLHAPASSMRIVDGATYERSGRLKESDVSRLGTRHSSVFAYCRADKRAVGVIASQDGEVRVVTSIGADKLALYEGVRLLRYSDDMGHVKEERRRRRQMDKKRPGYPRKGYTDMPHTISALSNEATIRRARKLLAPVLRRRTGAATRSAQEVRRAARKKSP